MHFNPGKFGALVVVLAILGTIVVGYCTDVTKVQTERTDYDYITDVTGLFDTEEIPEYIDYNPNSNYVGYSGNVVYQASTQPNNYRYVISEGENTSSSFTVNRSSSYAKPSAYSDYKGIYLNYTGSKFNMGAPISTGYGVQYNVGMLPLGANVGTITTLSTMLSTSIPNYTSYDTISINLNQGSWPVWFIPNPAQSLQYGEVDLGGSNPLQYYTGTLTDDNAPTRITVDVVTMTTTAYNGSMRLWSADGSVMLCLYGYFAPAYTTGDDSLGRAPVNVTFSATASLPPTYGYADPQGGVRMSGSYVDTTWENGYEIEEITILVGRDAVASDSSITILFEGNTALDSGEVELNFTTTTTSYKILRGGQVTTDVDVGKWQGTIVKCNFRTQTITLVPTGTIRDYTEIPALQGTAVVDDAEDTPDNTGWGFNAYYTPATSNIESARFGVVNTTVFLNSYGVVMQDPSIDIKDYWPDLDTYRLNFYSFALIGDSITINGANYPVGEDQRITVTDVTSEEQFTETLSNIYVTTEIVDGESRTYLTFVDKDLTVDLGTTVTDVVSFTGLWYFSTALYESYTTVGSEYVWNLDGTFSATAGQVLVIFLGLLGAGVICGRVLLGDSLGLLDYAIMIGAGVIALTMAVAFI